MIVHDVYPFVKASRYNPIQAIWIVWGRNQETSQTLIYEYGGFESWQSNHFIFPMNNITLQKIKALVLKAMSTTLTDDVKYSS